LTTATIGKSIMNGTTLAASMKVSWLRCRSAGGLWLPALPAL